MDSCVRTFRQKSVLFFVFYFCYMMGYFYSSSKDWAGYGILWRWTFDGESGQKSFSSSGPSVKAMTIVAFAALVYPLLWRH